MMMIYKMIKRTIILMMMMQWSSEPEQLLFNTSVFILSWSGDCDDVDCTDDVGCDGDYDYDDEDEDDNDDGEDSPPKW